jgi:hypothetical protein
MRILRFIGMTAFTCIWCACSSTEFSGSNSTRPGKTASRDSSETDEVDEGEQSPKPTVRSVTITIEQLIQETKTDIIWLVDNSGSMDQEAATVRDNLAKFATTTSSFTNAQTWIVSAATNAPVTIAAPTGDKIRQIDSYVGSTNGLGVLAGLLCPAATTSFDAQPKICGASVAPPATNTDVFWLEMYTAGGPIPPSLFRAGATIPPPYANSRYTMSNGSLNSELRSDAKKIIIAVTDDNALGVSAALFSTMMQSVIPAEQMRFFAIAAKPDSATRCDVANLY